MDIPTPTDIINVNNENDKVIIERETVKLVNFLKREFHTGKVMNYTPSTEVGLRVFHKLQDIFQPKGWSLTWKTDYREGSWIEIKAT